MLKLSLVFFLYIFLSLLFPNYSYAEKIEPPWSTPPAGGVNFTVPGIDNVPDLHGELYNPDLDQRYLEPSRC